MSKENKLIKALNNTPVESFRCDPKYRYLIQCEVKGKTYDHFFTNKKEALKMFDNFEIDFYSGCADDLISIKMFNLKTNKKIKECKCE